MGHKFKLSENFINKYKRKKAPFGFNGLGELVYIEYNFEPGEHFKEGDEIVSVESVKASNGILAPFDGKLVANNTLEENPQLVSDMPEDENTAWFCKIDKEFELIWINVN